MISEAIYSQSHERANHTASFQISFMVIFHAKQIYDSFAFVTDPFEQENGGAKHLARPGIYRWL
jgi:hypothetical protein